MKPKEFSSLYSCLQIGEYQIVPEGEYLCFSWKIFKMFS